MSFRNSVRVLLLIAGFVPVFAFANNSTDTPLEPQLPLAISPNKCVALNEGRTCFADVTFTLKLPDNGEYCLRERDNPKPIGCWKEAQTIHYLYSFARAETTLYELVRRRSGEVLGEAVVEVNWVHRIRTKKRRWRLF
ncbi:DUF3019 domain-containing protein [Pseudoalteromonas fenneropenaei]|uniref:DUF3019 domain-containing protein n=1 Tax=Pseudoalteromonas fenneropenaei TaxID=1737459 RepID=A0ABV7CM54_9GAMM